MTLVALTAVSLAGAGSGGAAGPGFAGLRLTAALARLEAEGLDLIYSSALVTDEMKVEEEPIATEARAILEEILASHGLAVQDAPGGRLVVVAGAPPKVPERRQGELPLTLDGTVFLNEIVVTPSHFRILDRQPEQRVFLSQEQVAQMPHAADDLYRAVKRLPGAAGGDYSASFNVRGGEQSELLVMLDGVELYEPFHLKDFQNMFSTIDAEAVGGVDFLTGGFPVEYGDRMSGVMDITSAIPTGPATTSLALSTFNARLVNEGSFNEGRGQWLVNTRFWYPGRTADLVLSPDKRIQTDYADLFAKIQHSVAKHSVLSGNLLFSIDDLVYSEIDDESSEMVNADYRSHQLWLNLRSNWTPRLYSQTVLSSGRIRRLREGALADLEDGTLEVNDSRHTEFYGFRQDWSYSLDDAHYLKWGWESTREKAVYDYASTQLILDPDEDEHDVERIENLVALSPAGTSYSFWVADRFRLGAKLVAELGLRWDRQFYIDEHQISPRFNLLYELGERSALRAAWGRFHQSQRLNELQVEDGVDEFYRAQLSEHSMVSFEHRFAGGEALRLEVYHKELEHLRPRYENLFNPLDLLPEGAWDRVEVVPTGGRSRGVELVFRADSRPRVQWWLSYGLAWAEDRIEGVLVPRSWDQRHSANAGLNLELPGSWNFNLAGSWHSGWPTTPVLAVPEEEAGGPTEYELVLGPRNGARLPDYLRFDVRARKRFHTSRGELEVVLEILNLFNRKNVCCRDDFEAVPAEGGGAEVEYKETYWAPVIPSLGLSWTF